MDYFCYNKDEDKALHRDAEFYNELLRTIKELHDKTLLHERDLHYFKQKEIEQNGLLLELTETTNNLDKKIDRLMYELRAEINHNVDHVVNNVYKKFYKQTLIIVTSLLIPLLIILLDTFLKR